MSFSNHSDGLAFIAKNSLIHGDIKPSNILISSEDENFTAFICDFGLTGQSGGTALYIAPEGLLQGLRVIEKTDVYSFAIMVLFLLFRTDLALKLILLPITSCLDDFRENLKNFALLEIIFRSLRKEPSARPDLQEWKDFLSNSQNCGWLQDKITTEYLESFDINLECLKLAEKSESVFLYEITSYLNDYSQNLENEMNDAWKMSDAKSRFENISFTMLNSGSKVISEGEI